jgi:hypothetical protein
MPRSSREAMQPAFDCDVDRVLLEGLAALPNLDGAQNAARLLERARGDRALFALCVLTLELARHQDEQARAALPSRVGVLLEAFRHPTFARVLVAGNPALESRWEKIRPIVGEFMASRPEVPQEAPQGVGADAASKERPPSVPAGDGPPARLSTSVEIIEELSVLLEHEKQAKTAEAPPPAKPGPLPARPPRKPPPPPPLTPPPVAIQPGRPPPLPTRAAAASAAAGSLSPSPAAVPSESPVDPSVRAFWAFAEQALGRAPDDNQSVTSAQCFAAEKSADRANLVRFARELVARFPKVREARALASLTLLYVAGQEKARGLLGVNRERLEILRIALTLLSDPEAGGHAAVLFEVDGLRTHRAFVNVVDILHSYLAFCLQHELDPLRPEAALEFTKA